MTKKPGTKKPGTKKPGTKKPGTKKPGTKKPGAARAAAAARTIGFIGLGRMGKNMVFNLLERGGKVHVWNRSPEPVQDVAAKGAIPAEDIEALVAKLPSPKVVWLMVTAGPLVDRMIAQVAPLLGAGDILIDGGNSYFEDTQRRGKALAKKGIRYLDCGTSGGMGGARHGACMMIGGDREAFAHTEWIYRTLSVEDGYGYMGASGAGHFVKMVHNGIEYGMMQSLAEGMNAIRDHQAVFGTDLRTAIRVYAHGSIVESKLASWLQDSYDEAGYLDGIEGTVPRGETEDEMEKLERLAPMPALRTARLERVRTRSQPSYGGKLLAAMRNQFGGHKVVKR
jgi:6-phosphogluconate dehydrogenase